MREVQFGQDGNFSWESMLARHNSELANGIGNLASRVLAMLGSYFAGQIPEGSAAGGALADEVAGFVSRYRDAMDDHGLSAGLAIAFELVSRLNGYLVERAPWTLAKEEGRADELAGVLYEVVEALRIAALMLWPAMPEAMDRLWADVGEPVLLSDGGDGSFDELATWGRLTPGTPTRRGEPLFPRLEAEA
jgi:methionyl-tRNA synthetase